MLVLYADQLDDDVRQWWHEMWDMWRANAEAEGFNLLPLRFGDLGADGLPAVEYRSLTRLPLASISSNPAWYGADPEGSYAGQHAVITYTYGSRRMKGGSWSQRVSRSQSCGEAAERARSCRPA